MYEVSLKSRAIAFAVCAGAFVFILALAATARGPLDAATTSRALIAAIICAVMCWAYAERNIASTAEAIDAAIERLARAANGDLQSDIPKEVAQHVPQLAGAMNGLFRQMHSNLESVQRLALYDPVTGLPNRTHFRRSSERILAQMPLDGRGALFFIDLDRFKAVNDTLGHAVGDQLLAMVANRLRAVAVRFDPNDPIGQPVIGRLSGDEFTVFFAGVTRREHVDQIARALLFALTESFDLADQEVKIGASVGVALRPEHGCSLTDLMRAADAAMYEAKEQGRGRIAYFTDTLADRLASRAALESDLRDALERKQFQLVYQPQISAADGRIVAAEALLRWDHPTRGRSLPGSFIARAEETGLIVEIGNWVIEQVAATIARWGRMGVAQRMTINVSQRQLDHAAFFRGLRQAMQAAGAPARLLELEINETLIMNCSREVIHAVAALRADGACIAVDDFGTGYSSLSRLRDLPLDRIKLDRSLVEHVATNIEARTIAQAVVGLIHGFGCEVVAEGIESAAQADVLRVIGCDILQGYAIAKPMCEEEFLSWARATTADALHSAQ